MVSVTWRSLMPVIIISSFIIYEEWVSFPSSKILPNTAYNPDKQVGNEDDSPEDLKVMMVVNLLLLGSEAGFANLYFRLLHVQKSFQSLNPDMLLVLGDVSAKGSELSRTKWDVGQCSGLRTNSVNWIARNFPGLDSSGCGAFEISNISFVSLNAAALLCGKSDDFRWRVNAMKSGSGNVPASTKRKGFSGTDPYDLSQTVPPNAAEYIFNALKPRIIFSAHTHEFSDHTHPDGTQEVTILAMTWKVRDDPHFIVATFQRNRSTPLFSSFEIKEHSSLTTNPSSLALLRCSVLSRAKFNGFSLFVPIATLHAF
ncbi:Calcineurin-like metallo-phosphoesterase superfamily protein, putative isoform 2 [Hibiscus syriacus]|uniref:Calcineurin-like metallo-phosphoesterase superfamily protein, putative isoform 2 n=1 Tax=Hibiscus syriacus TaxID=106335 RepID=A0A6A3CVQ7_HIBSY|nr:Calcineurin-like metallo-phosphoesterase superfamily protein, putative isoform 2 [Hibiscus syriacus]